MGISVLSCLLTWNGMFPLHSMITTFRMVTSVVGISRCGVPGPLRVSQADVCCKRIKVLPRHHQPGQPSYRALSYIWGAIHAMQDVLDPIQLLCRVYPQTRPRPDRWIDYHHCVIYVSLISIHFF